MRRKVAALGQQTRFRMMRVAAGCALIALSLIAVGCGDGNASKASGDVDDIDVGCVVTEGMMSFLAGEVARGKSYDDIEEVLNSKGSTAESLSHVCKGALRTLLSHPNQAVTFTVTHPYGATVHSFHGGLFRATPPDGSLRTCHDWIVDVVETLCLDEVLGPPLD
jgi:hypothetical protein